MKDTSLRPTPRPREVVRTQVRAVGIALRWPALVAAVLLAATTVLGAAAMHQGEVFDFHPEQTLVPALLGLLLPIAVWMGQDRFGAGFLWTLPVDRRRHALARVLAGWVWLMGIVGVFFLWLLALSLLSGESVLAEETLRLLPADARARMDAFPFPGPGMLDPEALETVHRRPQPLLWLTPFTAATGAYLLASAVALGIRLRWGAAALVALFLLGALGEAADLEWLMHAPHRYLRPLLLGPYGLDTLLTGRTEYLKVGVPTPSGDSFVVWRELPDPGQWALATLLWILVALLAVWAAASRHRERRRP